VTVLTQNMNMVQQTTMAKWLGLFRNRRKYEV